MTPAYTYSATVTRIVDGDTIRVDWDLGAHIWLRDVPIRLIGVNAPEMRGTTRPAGLAARTWLAEHTPVGSTITIKTEKGDAFGRYLATVWANDTCINDELIAAGHGVKF